MLGSWFVWFVSSCWGEYLTLCPQRHMSVCPTRSGDYFFFFFFVIWLEVAREYLCHISCVAFGKLHVCSVFLSHFLGQGSSSRLCRDEVRRLALCGVELFREL